MVASIVLCLSCGFLFNARAIPVSGSYIRISTALLSMDSVCAFIAGELSRIHAAEESEQALIGLVSGLDELGFALRTNAKGIIINKVQDGKVAQRTSRSVGTQTWHKTVEVSGKPYYGAIIQKKEVSLFWIYPVARGNAQFAGCVAFKINLRRLFERVAEKQALSFKVVYRDNLLFSNLSDSASTEGTRYRIPVFGLQAVYLECATGETAAISPAAKQNVPPRPESVETTKEPVAQSQSAAAFSPVQAVDAGGAFSIRNAGMIIAVVVFCSMVLVVCFLAMQRAAGKRRKLLEAIDKGNA
jgi:hypothetical protein